ncbi:MAG: glycoside hydrolase family 1 protein [Deltaproteobacteria bacterium]|nr:glycoside hydrolase family 1 protein [Deltaproteobacteria bacterium]
MKLAVALAGVVVVGACGGDDGPDPAAPISYGAMGPLSGDAGRGGFRFGAASAATQIEDMNESTDWYLWTAPTAQGGLGKGTFVGDATRGYSKVMEDLALVRDLGLDSYRFSIEWARIEPVRDQIDEAAIAHYRAQLEALRALGIRPLVTLHHFSNPVWVADPRAIACTAGPSDTNLCGLGSPGGAQVVAEMAEHAGLMAERFGDLVDEWGTLNEPINYLVAGYGLGLFPPGLVTINDFSGKLVPVVRDYIAAHAAMYDAIKAKDTVDADGDGIAATVGLSMSVADWRPSRSAKPSTDPEDIAARDRLVYVFHYVFVDSILNGTFDASLDGTSDETHPEWAGRLDWLGLQYYFRAGVTGASKLIPLVDVTPCFGGFDLGSCLPAPDPTYCVPRMGYEGYADGLGDVVMAFAARYPGMPLVITEAGISTDAGRRRAENIVRNLESLERARAAGVDLRGYYHWSLTDNFEWAEGFGPHFGLYRVDYSTYARTATEGADVLGRIAKARGVTAEQRRTYGGTGPMTPEPGFENADPFCGKP